MNQADQTEPHVPTLTFSLRQTKELLACFGGDDTHINVQQLKAGHFMQDDGQPMPAGLYAHLVDYPEEGCQFLGSGEINDGTPTVIGEAFAGGFYAGRISVGPLEYALIVAPKTEGETNGTWLDRYEAVPDARFVCDGLANTAAMAEAGSQLAAWARSLRIGGFDDWYLPSRDELELMYRNLKPTGQKNSASFRDGENVSSLPVGPAYTEDRPAQTRVEAFREWGDEAMEPTWYWASTQGSPYYAWYQDFANGNQSFHVKDSQLRARAVRRFLIA